MAEYRVTKAALIEWVRTTEDGREFFADHCGDDVDIEDYLSEHGHIRGIVDLLAGDIDYPGDGNWEAKAEVVKPRQP